LFRIQKPVSTFIQELKDEDPQVKNAALLDHEGFKISGSTQLGEISKPGIKLVINDKNFSINFPLLAGIHFFFLFLILFPSYKSPLREKK